MNTNLQSLVFQLHRMNLTKDEESYIMEFVLTISNTSYQKGLTDGMKIEETLREIIEKR